MRIKKVLVGTAVAAGLVGGLAAGVGPAYADDWSGADQAQAVAKSDWNCGGLGVVESPHDEGGKAVLSYCDDDGMPWNLASMKAEFQPYGEKLKIHDTYYNDHRTVVYVTTGSGSKKVFGSEGGTVTRDLGNIKEGKRVIITACTSTSSQSKCGSTMYGRA